uniref:(northern house mosquito) hypothetical protein n=1 Tax=Culex pipiens TaxID=7175 RepID=A0A8D8HII1_CULPI
MAQGWPNADPNGQVPAVDGRKSVHHQSDRGGPGQVRVLAAEPVRPGHGQRAADGEEKAGTPARRPIRAHRHRRSIPRGGPRHQPNHRQALLGQRLNGPAPR